MTEFNLSKRIDRNGHDIISEVIAVEDVKEFIRLLKDSFIEDWKFCKKANVEPFIHPRRVIEKIDKLAGDLAK